MLIWTTNNPPAIKGTYQHNPDHGAITLILDGQQRITTLYMLIRGKIPPYYQEHDIKTNPSSLCVHLQTLELEYYAEKKMGNNPLRVKVIDIFQDKVKTISTINRIKAQD